MEGTCEEQRCQFSKLMSPPQLLLLLLQTPLLPHYTSNFLFFNLSLILIVAYEAWTFRRKRKFKCVTLLVVVNIF